MQKYISILRGINVGGNRVIKMDVLKMMYQNLNFTNIKTYIQSGNVIFESKNTDCETLASTISQKIKQTFGYDVPVIVKTKDEMNIVLANNPFINSQEAQFLHLTFLSAQPTQDNINKIKGDFGNDAFVFAQKSVYLYCPNGYSNTKLTNGFLESKLNVMATTRNWKTVATLTEMINQE
jgi:uncharacterized protein (DUF1697 family)